jgi:hypothetical protein
MKLALCKLNCLRSIVAWFVLLGVASAFGQQTPAESMGSSRLRSFAHREVRTADARGQANISGGPQWSTNWVFTTDTALAGHTATYDPATNTMVIFGGVDWGMEATDTNAVTLYAPANGNGSYTILIPDGAAGSPPARDDHTAVYDSANNRMIIFGGTIANPPFSYFNDVWVLSNANGQGGTPVWTQLTPSGAPPAARYAHTAVYDSTTNQMTIFAGSNDAQDFRDVWVLSHANGLGGAPAWTQLSPSGTAPLSSYFPSAVYDSVNNIMTVFGGANAADTACVNGVWTLSHANGLGGTPQWTNTVANGAAGSPSKRFIHSAVYDPASNRMIIFGGDAFAGTASYTGFNDVWVLTSANGMGGASTWIKLNVSGLKPGTRGGHTAVYDATNNKMMVFAGGNFDANFYDTWVLSHANGL